MKHRVVDLLKCRCGKSGLVVKVNNEKRVPFSGNFDQPRCETSCSFKQCLVSKVVPADCGECYSREIVDGVISCTCGQEWPVMSGVPRFLPNTLVPEIKKTQSTFSFEWKHFRFGERNWGQSVDDRKSLFLRAFGVKAAELKNKVIFDAGCGSGLLAIEMAESLLLQLHGAWVTHPTIMIQECVDQFDF